MAWGYLARAYAIAEYAYLRATETEPGNIRWRTDKEADTIESVRDDIKYVLELAEEGYISAKETPDEYKTIRQCKRWLKDFG